MVQSEKNPSFVIFKESTTTCFSMECAVKVFAVLNIIVTSLSSILSIGTLIYWVTQMVLRVRTRKRVDSDGVMFVFFFLQCAGIILILISSCVAFLFAGFLVNGVFKKKPDHMKAYFVYGVVVSFLSSLSAIGYLVLTNMEDMLTFNLVFLVICVYAWTLSMIRRTYRKYETSIQQFSHNILENTKY